MVRYLKLLVIVPVAVVLITLAVINRGPVTLRYLPQQFGEAVINVPMFVALFLALMAGVIIGGAASWWVQGRHRRLERAYRREAEKLKSEAERLRAMQPVTTGLALPAIKT